MAENLKVEFDLKDVSEDDAAREELIEKGGKQQVPFLVDSEKGESMYETSDIIEYIRDNYANSAAPSDSSKPRVHVSNAVCESCEG